MSQRLKIIGVSSGNSSAGGSNALEFCGGLGYGSPGFSRAWYIDGGTDVDKGGKTAKRIDIAVEPGYVNGFVPYINGVKINNSPAPRLKTEIEYNSYGRSYIAIRVAVDWETGILPTPPGPGELSIINTARIDKNSPVNEGVWHHPIAVIHHTGIIERVCYMNLLHWTSFTSGVLSKYYPEHYFSVA